MQQLPKKNNDLAYEMILDQIIFPQEWEIELVWIMVEANFILSKIESFIIQTSSST